MPFSPTGFVTYKDRALRSLVLAALIMLPAAAAGQQSDLAPPLASQPDFEIARGAVERGEILPLARVLETLARVHPGRVIEVELEFDDDLLIYEVELVTPDGRLIEVELNAATGEILSMEEED